LPDGEAEKIRARLQALTAEMNPQTAAGAILITKMATLSVRMERAADHETAAIALNVRHAAENFDDERIEAAKTLFEQLADDPRATLRKLKRTSEGVERLLDAWTDLRADLAVEPKPIWSDDQVELAANLIGLKARHAQASRFAALTRAMNGDFAALSASDGAGLDEAGRKEWAMVALFEAIDAEMVALEAHHDTLDFDTLALDRAEAGVRALFDDSKSATLARRYEADARRGFFKALKEFRQIEAEFAAQAEATPTAPSSAQAGSTVGSFRQRTAPPAREPVRPSADSSLPENSSRKGEDGQPLVYVPSVKTRG
jgi:hypothetical protein